jgi:hypothetical protein
LEQNTDGRVFYFDRHQVKEHTGDQKVCWLFVNGGIEGLLPVLQQSKSFISLQTSFDSRCTDDCSASRMTRLQVLQGRLNRGGRRFLQVDGNNLPMGKWPLVLERASRVLGVTVAEQQQFACLLDKNHCKTKVCATDAICN